MANVAELFDINQKHFVGKIVCTKESFGNILDVQIPESKDIITFTAKDMQVNKIKVLNEFIPIFAENSIDYAGQPVVAIFGESRESVDDFASKIKIVTDSAHNISDIQPEPYNEPFVYNAGDIAKYFSDSGNIVTSEFCILNHPSLFTSGQRIAATYKDSCVYIKVATQWPLHVRNTVADVLKISTGQVKIVPQTFHSDFDQLAILPSIVAAIAAQAAVKTGCLIQMLVSFTTYQPKLTFKFSTEVDENGTPLAHKVIADADMGAFPIFSDEFCANVLAGLTPVYKTNALSVNINIFKSHAFPSNFFGDLGYSATVTATECHFNRLIRKINMFPSNWRINNIFSGSINEKIKKTSDSDALKLILAECVENSRFDRNYSVYSQSSAKNAPGQSIVPYARGIGIACNHGINGFSNKFAYAEQYSLKTTYNQHGKIFVTLGMQTGRHLKNVYREIVQKYIDIKPENIIFSDINDIDICDTGPNVLSREIGTVPKLLENACFTIATKLAAKTELPISEESCYVANSSAPYFDSNCCGAVVVNMHMDMVRIIPVIDQITVRIKLGKVYDTANFTNSIRQTVTTAISEICPCAENITAVDLRIRSNPKNASSSCDMLIRCLTASALVSAISQALGDNITKIPITEEELTTIVLKREKANATELHN